MLGSIGNWALNGVVISWDWTGSKARTAEDLIQSTAIHGAFLSQSSLGSSSIRACEQGVCWEPRCMPSLISCLQSDASTPVVDSRLQVGLFLDFKGASLTPFGRTRRSAMQRGS